ncbi:MAG: histidine-type phosphatase [Candidatus Cryptobacteroides sp.]
MNMSRKTSILSLCILLCIGASAQVTKENAEKDLYITAGVHHPYIVPEIKDTKAPRGFKAFYVTHYGRHGSRYHTSESFFNDNVPRLDILAEKGLLTEDGLKLKAEMEWLQQRHSGMAGTLTETGGFEQQGVAQRLYERCPEIFRQKNCKQVSSRSTNVHRVIQSMGHFNASLKACQKDLQITMLTGDRYWDILCHNTGNIENPFKERQEFLKDSLHRAYIALLHPEHLFNNPAAVEELCGINANELEFKLFEATQITRTLDHSEGHDPLAIFPLDDLVNMGRAYNIHNFVWFMHSIEGGNINERAVGIPILKDMLKTAEEAIAGNGHCADFRFGHDSGVGPLAAMLEIGDYAKTMHIADSPDCWPAYKNLCMCSNVQLIFYRNNTGEILVKVLLNEKEVQIGESCPPFCGPYYRWEDFRKYAEGRISDGQ